MPTKTKTPASSPFLPLGSGITRIDTGLMREGMAACYLIEENGYAGIIETGINATVPRILDLLEQKGISRSQVAYVMPTHVHLDHAGGVGALMQLLPEAQLVIHPRGARHMVDPSKLTAGSIAVYGEKAFREMYGEIQPVPESRIIIAEEGMKLDLNGRELLFLDTPGHARHHLCIYDASSAGIFTGDTFGLAYPEMGGDQEPFIFPTTTPVQFDPEALKRSIKKLLSLRPEKMYLTHFGVVEQPETLSEALLQQIDDYVDIALGLTGAEDRVNVLQTALIEYTMERWQPHGSPLTEEQCRGRLQFDMALNAQGLDIWLQQQGSKT